MCKITHWVKNYWVQELHCVYDYTVWNFALIVKKFLPLEMLYTTAGSGGSDYYQVWWGHASGCAIHRLRACSISICYCMLWWWFKVPCLVCSQFQSITICCYVQAAFSLSQGYWNSQVPRYNQKISAPVYDLGRLVCRFSYWSCGTVCLNGGLWR